MKRFQLRLLCTTALTCLLANSSFHWEGLTTFNVNVGDAAVAKATGGRSGGGSFRSSPSRSNSSGSSSSSTRSNQNRTPSQPSYNHPYNNGGGGVVPIPVPVPVGPSHTYSNPSYSNPGYNNSPSQSSSSSQANQTAQPLPSWLPWLVVLLGGSGIGLLIWLIVKGRKGSGIQELDNDTVTISKIQVALLAEARSIQDYLSKISLDANTDTPAGLMYLLQESALALLRMPENWSHVLTSSQVVRSREEAEAVFNQLSITERTKFSSETLTNVGGRVSRRQPLQPELDDDGPAAYIVVTLLLGTAYDKPLFGEIRTVEALQETLQKLASLPPEYLMVFELLWTPQDESDSFSYDELLLEYPEMFQL